VLQRRNLYLRKKQTYQSIESIDFNVEVFKYLYKLINLELKEIKVFENQVPFREQPQYLELIYVEQLQKYKWK